MSTRNEYGPNDGGIAGNAELIPDVADELSYLVKNKKTHSKTQHMVWSIGNELANVEEAEIKQWDGSVLSSPPIPFFDEKGLYYNFGYI